jgi:hypothetical protein
MKAILTGIIAKYFEGLQFEWHLLQQGKRQLVAILVFYDVAAHRKSTDGQNLVSQQTSASCESPLALEIPTAMGLLSAPNFK